MTKKKSAITNTPKADVKLSDMTLPENFKITPAEKTISDDPEEVFIDPNEIIIPTATETTIIRTLQQAIQSCFVDMARVCKNPFRAEHLIYETASEHIAYLSSFIQQGVQPINEPELTDYSENWAQFLQVAMADLPNGAPDDEEESEE